ncbi:MAG TPA: Ig-like domain repeat protein [Terriglobales bacterium]|nr:Ig-like domain repeat protein [Terriglobales bacterium]
MKKFACLAMLVGITTSLSAALTGTTTTIASSLNPSSYGQSVTFTATVTSSQGAPPDGETITFLQGTTVLGTNPLSGGSATFSTAALTGGTDNIKASYPGDGTFGSSKSRPVAQVVNLASTATALTSSPNPSSSGQAVVFTATVTGVINGIPITGNVAFYDGSTKLGSQSLSNGVATYKNAKLSVSSHSITALYLGNKIYSTSTSNALNQVVSVPQIIDSTMTFDGITRYYEVYVPVTVTANPAMLLMLHGTQNKTDPQDIISLMWGWQSIADANGFILVKPASTFNSKSGQWNWNAYYMDSAFTSDDVGTCTVPPATGCPNDAGFLAQLITNLSAQYNVDPKRVFVAGFSSGAQMAHRIAVEDSNLVAAVVIGSGTIVGQLNPPPIVLPGPAVEPVSIQEWHGTNDGTIPPCNNGTTGYSGVKFYLATVDDSFNYWTSSLSGNSCSTFQNTIPLCKNGAPNQSTTGNDATSCANGVEVQFVWEEGLGHTWANNSDAARWQFLAAHPKP